MHARARAHSGPPINDILTVHLPEGFSFLLAMNFLLTYLWNDTAPDFR
jgi:hypothetical protein